jgi:RNA polymerase sigma-70 factor (ECF subfamily)
MNMRIVSETVLEEWNGISDEQVVASVLTGQIRLFEVLMRRHNKRLYRTARAIIGDDRQAEDVMQQAYVNAYARLREYDGKHGFAKWLTRILVVECLARRGDRGCS